MRAKKKRKKQNHKRKHQREKHSKIDRKIGRMIIQSLIMGQKSSLKVYLAPKITRIIRNKTLAPILKNTNRLLKVNTKYLIRK